MLRQVYGVHHFRGGQGYVANRILYARELTEYEKRIFAEGMVLSPNFLTQALYKVCGNFTPLRFNRVLHTMIEKSDILRTNYCPTDQGTLAVVFGERKDLPKIVYQNMSYMEPEEVDTRLRKAMEADMREEFDLRHGNILRFTVFHTGGNEYAVLATVAQAILDRVDMREIFLRVIGQEISTEEREHDAAPLPRKPALGGAMREYWAQMLSDLPKTPALPCRKTARRGEIYRQRVYRKVIPTDIMSDLREKAKSNRMMLMAILQTAWGFVLQECNNSCKDVFFCLLVPERKEKGNRLQNSGFNMMPVRIKNSGNMSVQKLAAQQFQQLLVSQPYSCFDWEGLRELTGGQTFDHFLSFFDFMVEEQKYSEVTATQEGTLVMRNSWDARGAQLGIYFRYEDGHVSFSVMYDERRFMPDGGNLLANRYLLALQQMITDWNLDLDAFMGRLSHRIWEAEKEDSALQRKSESERMVELLDEVEVLQNVDRHLIQHFAKNGRLERKFEGDRISGSVMENCLIFVAFGKVARNVDTGDGWYNTLDILKAGAWVNDTVFLTDRKTQCSAEVLTEEAEILVCPMGGVRDFVSKYPEFVRGIIKHLTRQLEKYQRLWMQA